MPQLDVLWDLVISFNVDNSWMSWTLDIEIVSPILVASDASWTWYWIHWKVYLVLFLSICRMLKYDFICLLYINLNPRWF
jgi:hypothetical protein